MTPEEIEDVYYQAYSKAQAEFIGRDHLIQSDIKKKAWQAVLDAIYEETDKQWADRYLAMSRGIKLMDLNIK